MQIGQEQRVLSSAPEAQGDQTVLGELGGVAEQLELAPQHVSVGRIVLGDQDELARRAGPGQGDRRRSRWRGFDRDFDRGIDWQALHETGDRAQEWLAAQQVDHHDRRRQRAQGLAAAAPDDELTELLASELAHGDGGVDFCVNDHRRQRPMAEPGTGFVQSGDLGHAGAGLGQPLAQIGRRHSRPGDDEAVDPLEQARRGRRLNLRGPQRQLE
ncbi:MAG TPA: hypothetical protein VNS61_09125, partial [Caldimonas sp.]|nr:hypothetical protein [Caldimonas sp.]